MNTSLTPPLLFWLVRTVVLPVEVVTGGGARGAELCVGGEIRRPDVVESVIDAQVEALDIEARAGRCGIDLRTRGVLILQADMADIEKNFAAHLGGAAEVH